MSLPLIAEQPVTPEYITSGASRFIYNDTEPLDFGVIAKNNNSNHKNIDLKFNPDPDFDPTDESDGYFEPVLYSEGFPILNGTKMVYKEVAAWTTEDTADLSGTDVYTVEVDTDAVNKLDTAAFDTAEGRTKIIQVQLQRTDVDISAAYNTAKKANANPSFIIEWFRAVTNDLNNLFPNPESDHLWNFSSADLVWRVKNNPGSGEVEQRYKLGWFADEDFEVNFSHELTEFGKGKPAATAATFLAKCISEINGQTIYESDNELNKNKIPFFIIGTFIVLLVILLLKKTKEELNQNILIQFLDYYLENYKKEKQ